MQKKTTKLTALLLASMIALSGCGGNGGNTNNGGDAKPEGGSTTASDTKKDDKKDEKKDDKKDAKADDERITDLVLPVAVSRELETFNILYAQRQEDSENLTNLVDGLLEADPQGKLVPAIAESWETNDGGLTWTFHIRDGVKWVNVKGEEMADCNAQDFATGLEWVLNFHKNDSANTSMPLEMIKGAKEYYEYTKSLSKEEAYALNGGEGSKFREMVGFEVPDDNTVVYHCLAEKPYFDSLGTYNCLYPAPQALIDEMGPEAYKAINNENMWYNGCYTMTEYLQGNEKVFTKNPLYWDKDCTLFDTATFKMSESNDISYQLYESGEVDTVGLGEARINTIAKNPNDPLYGYMVPDVPSKHSYQYHFNWDKKKEDGTPDTNWNTAIANESFRRSWYYGLNLADYFKRSNAINPMVCENNYYTMKGLCYTSDGTDYVDLVRKELGLPEMDGKTPVRLNAEKYEAAKAQAIEELTALGVTFPVEVDYYIIGSNQTALDSANVLKQAFTNSFGDDYIKLNIKTYIKSLRQEVVQAHLQSLVSNGWGADYGDPQNFLGQELIGYDNADYSAHYSFINDVEETPETKALLDTYREFTKMVEEADKITDDMDARYAAYAKAEAYMLDKVLVLPVNYGIGWCLTKVVNDTKINAMFGIQNNKMKNWETKKSGYTSAEKGVADQIAAFTAASAQ